jgi:hypothetical protein
MRPCNGHILEALELVKKMLLIAEQGDIDREDVGCGILYGVIRDSAYKIKRLADTEKKAHQEKGWWFEEENCTIIE